MTMAMTEQEFRNMLQDILEKAKREYNHLGKIETFQSAGLRPHSEGLVVRMSDGSDFLVTVKIEKVIIASEIRFKSKNFFRNLNSVVKDN